MQFTIFYNFYTEIQNTVNDTYIQHTESTPHNNYHFFINFLINTELLKQLESPEVFNHTFKPSSLTIHAGSRWISNKVIQSFIIGAVSLEV